MYRIHICDNSIHYANRIKNILKDITDKSIQLNITFSHNSDCFINNLNNERYHLIIMGYNFGNMTGYELAKIAREQDKKFVLVFYVSEKSPEPKFFKLNIFRYIMKSTSDEHIKFEFTDILNHVKSIYDFHIIEFRAGWNKQYLNSSHIVYIHKLKYGSNIIYYNHNKKEYSETKSTEHISSLYEKLDKSLFTFPQSSFLVNLSKVASRIGNRIYMENGDYISISRHNRDDFCNIYTEHLKKNL